MFDCLSVRMFVCLWISRVDTVHRMLWEKSEAVLYSNISFCSSLTTTLRFFSQTHSLSLSLHVVQSTSLQIFDCVWIAATTTTYYIHRSITPFQYSKSYYIYIPIFATCTTLFFTVCCFPSCQELLVEHYVKHQQVM